MKLGAPSAFRVACIVSAGASALATPSIAGAAEDAVFLNAPAAASSPSPKLAAQFQLKFNLPEGQGLARLLLDAGVNQDDAAKAARLAAGHMGAGVGGCSATVSIERSTGATAFDLVRVLLSSAAEQTVIERRGTELAIASATPASKSPRFV